MGSHVAFGAASASQPFKVLILGGCYAGLSAALNLVDLSEGRAARQGSGVVPGHDGKIPIEVTVVDERDGFYHLIGSPLALADTDFAKKSWVKYTDIPALQTPKITILQGTATGIDPATKTATISPISPQAPHVTLSYDYLVVATGLRRAWPVVPQSLHRSHFLAEANAHIAAVTPSSSSPSSSAPGVVVVGGGAVGIEMAAELKLLHPTQTVTLVHSRAKLLSNEPLPDECKDRAMDLVREAGVDLKMSTRLADVTTACDDGKMSTQRLTFENGETMNASVVIRAVSASVPSTEFLPAGVKDEEGLVLVRPNLMFKEAEGGDINVPNADAHFAIGDVIRWSGIKRCGGAMHMGFSVAHNIHELVLERLTGAAPTFVELGEIPPMIGLAVGKKAVSYSPAQGVESGEGVMEMFFGSDLGFDICWRYMKLGQKTGTPHGGPLESGIHLEKVEVVHEVAASA